MRSADDTRIEVTRTHLELASLAGLRRGRAPSREPKLERRWPIAAADYLALYRLVGHRWRWHDRLAWPTSVLQSHLDAASVHVYTATVGTELAGYFELSVQAEGDVELMYFGLAEAFIGRQLGGWLLTRAVEIAFTLDAHRMVLNTCTLDGPHALPNYLARGFRIVREERYEVERETTKEE